MAAGAARGYGLRILRQRQEERRRVLRQHQLQGKTQRRVEGQQLAIAAQFQRRKPGGLIGRGLVMLAVDGRLRLHWRGMAGMPVWIMLGMQRTGNPGT